MHKEEAEQGKNGTRRSVPNAPICESQREASSNDKSQEKPGEVPSNTVVDYTSHCSIDIEATV